MLLLPERAESLQEILILKLRRGEHAIWMTRECHLRMQQLVQSPEYKRAQAALLFGDSWPPPPSGTPIA